MPSKRDIENSIENIIAKKNNLTIKCRYQNLTELRNRLEDFTPEERENLISDIMRSINFGRLDKELLHGNEKDYRNLLECNEVTYKGLKEYIERGWIGKDKYNDEYDNIEDFIKQEYPNISKFDKIWCRVFSNDVYTEKEYWDKRFEFERNILELLSPDEIADKLAHNGDLYDTNKQAMDRISELKLTPPDWLVARVHHVEIERVNAIVGNSSEVRNHASHTNGIRELHTEHSNADGGLFTVIADNKEDAQRLADKVGANQLVHEEGNMYTISVPYSL